MAVYVDDMEAVFGRMVMCHMVADTVEELHAMADKIGVARKWVQHPDDPARVHYDIAKSKRALALRAGAISVTWRWCGLRSRAIRLGVPVPPLEESDGQHSIRFDATEIIRRAEGEGGKPAPPPLRTRKWWW